MTVSTTLGTLPKSSYINVQLFLCPASGLVESKSRVGVSLGRAQQGTGLAAGTVPMAVTTIAPRKGLLSPVRGVSAIVAAGQRRGAA